MAVSILDARRPEVQRPEKESTFDKIMKALQLAQSSFGIAADYQTIKNAQASRATLEQANKQKQIEADYTSPLSVQRREAYKAEGLNVPDSASATELEAQYGLLSKIKEESRARAAKAEEQKTAHAFKLKEIEAKKLGAGPALSPAEKATDISYAKKYTSWQEERPVIGEKLSAIAALKDSLETREGLTGTFEAKMPKGARDLFGSDSAAAEDRAVGLVAESLRPILGAQFTQKDREVIAKATYNSSLSQAENASRLGELMNKISSIAEAKDAQAAHYEKFGTMKGFNGKKIDYNYFRELASGTKSALDEKPFDPDDYLQKKVKK